MYPIRCTNKIRKFRELIGKLQLYEQTILLHKSKKGALFLSRSNHGRVLTHQSILSNVWRPFDADHAEYLRVYVRQIRKKLDEDPERPQYILTEPGVGYRFVADE